MSPDDLSRLSSSELTDLVVQQQEQIVQQREQIVELQRVVAALRDEVARLKGGPGRPNIKPSGIEKATEPKPPGKGRVVVWALASTIVFLLLAIPSFKYSLITAPPSVVGRVLLIIAITLFIAAAFVAGDSLVYLLVRAIHRRDRD